jgi:hypothetical protein
MKPMEIYYCFNVVSIPVSHSLADAATNLAGTIIKVSQSPGKATASDRLVVPYKRMISPERAE